MYPVTCSECGQDYTDTNERLMIMLHGVCFSCLISLQEWDNEGGSPNRASTSQ